MNDHLFRGTVLRAVGTTTVGDEKAREIKSLLHATSEDKILNSDCFYLVSFIVKIKTFQAVSPE